MHTSLLPGGQRSLFKAIQIQIKQTHKSPGQNQINSSSWSAQLAKVPIRGYGNMVVRIPKTGRENYPTMLRISRRITIILQGKYLSSNFKFFFDMLRIVG